LTRIAIPTALVLLAGCKAETGFSNQDPGSGTEEGNGQLEYTPEVVEYPDLDVAVTHSEMLKLTSVGEDNLVVYEVRILDSAEGVFYTEEVEDVTLAPGISREFPVSATLQAEGYVVGTVRIQCNDPDLVPEFEVPLHAWSAGYAPDDTGFDDTGPS
jgi:hypothetical protein